MIPSAHLIRGVLILPALLIALGAGGTLSPAIADDEQPTPEQTPEAVVDWLDKLERRGREIRSLQANVVYEKNNKLLGDRQFRTGSILYHDAEPAPEQREPRFAIRFEQLIVNGARREERVEYIFDGSWLAEKNHGNKLFIRRQVVPPGETLDPLQSDGLVPVPSGQERDAVLRRVPVELVDPPEEVENLPGDPEQPLHLRLTPREDAPRGAERKRFQQVDMWFNRDTLLPLMVRTVDDQQVETTVKLSDVRANEIEEEKIAERFDTTPPEEGWRVEITPWQDLKNE
jgi:hypothetical protein